MSEYERLFDLSETCPDCGGETGFGPCACGVDRPEALYDSKTRTSPKSAPGHERIVPANGMGGMREMVRRKLARKATS